MPLKRKRSSLAATTELSHQTATLPPGVSIKPPPLLTKRQSSRRLGNINTNPDQNVDIVDGKSALRASPDADGKDESLNVQKVSDAPRPPLTIPARTNGVKKGGVKKEDSESPASDVPKPVATPKNGKRKAPTKSSIAAKRASDEIKAFKVEQAAKKAAGAINIKKEDGEDEWNKRQDPGGDEGGSAEDIDMLRKEAARPPPVNTSILEHRHPLKDPSQPEHATKNRPDKTQPASIERGQRYVEELCLANVRDLPKMIRWNDKYGIKFMRLSSEMFPFASHAEYGYKLAPFASEELADAGRVIAELGHRVSTHPGQYTQLGSPRPEVISNAIRDLEYHDQMLSLLKLPEQENRDAVMILHMGGTFGDKAATLDRFRENYKRLSPSIKNRLVLENDDVSWSVHDLLPVCEELNIPLCLDFHHHNIIFDANQVREGTLDIMNLYPPIRATWERKNIRQKMHYSESCPEAITSRQRRKHNPCPITLPPCPNDMDLMIEAKDKEQACFELMRTLKLPGWDTFNNIIPYERDDDNRPLPKKAKKKKTKKQIASEIGEFGKEVSEEEEAVKELVPESEVGMGGKENRVYWPVGMEEWLRPKKREVKGKNTEDEQEIFRDPTPANFAARRAIMERNRAALSDEVKEKLREARSVADLQRILDEVRAERAAAEPEDGGGDGLLKKRVKTIPAKKGKGMVVKRAVPAKRKGKGPRTPSLSNLDEEEDLSMPDLSAEGEDGPSDVKRNLAKAAAPARQSGRARKMKASYIEPDADADEDDE
ncbi:UV-endonuclease UvdE-domain-containing protein [Tricladium varicosporioides]|nr:UV-endonuclease UvdE-domain-containing protein [Hymenoscyphus varicosporioides]